VLSVLWGGSFFFVEVALEELGPLTVVTGRVGLAAAALVGLVYLGGGRMPLTPRLWGAFLVMGALNNLIPFSLIAWGQVHIDSGLASILNATTPLFTVVLAHFLTAEERLTPGRLAGVLLGLCGVAVLIGPEALAGLGLAGLGQVAVLAAALSYAFAGIFGRCFKGLPPAVAAAGMLSATTVMILPLALVVERPWSLSPSGETLGAMLGLALLSTAAPNQLRQPRNELGFDHLPQLFVDGFVATDGTQQRHRCVEPVAATRLADVVVGDLLAQRFMRPGQDFVHAATGVETLVEQRELGAEVALHQGLIDTRVTADFSEANTFVTLGGKQPSG